MRYLRAYQTWYEKSFGLYISTEDGGYSKLNLIRSPWFALCFLVLFSIILALLYNAWMFTPAGYLDPWYYVGYGYTFDDRKFAGHLKGEHYKLSRILWIFLQYIVRKFFSPLSVTYIVQYFCLWLGTFSVYFTIRRLLGHVPAFIAAVFLCIYQPFLGSGGADYHNTLVGPLYALSFLILTIAAQKEKRALMWLVLFGCVYGMTAHTLILYVNFAPIMLIHFYAVRKVFCKENISLIKFLAATLLGFALATVILGLLSTAYGYRFLFFLPQLNLTSTFLYGGWATSPWWKPWSEWVLDAYWLGPLTAMMLFSLGSLLFHRKKSDIKPHRITRISQNLHLQFVCICAIWLFWQFLKKDTLNTHYFAYPLIIPFTMSMAASFSVCLSTQKSSSSFPSETSNTSFTTFSYYLPMILGIVAMILLSLKMLISFKFLFQIPLFVSEFLLFSVALSLFFFYKRRPWQNTFAVAVLAVGCLLYPACCYQDSVFPLRDGYLAITEATQWLYNTYGRRDMPDRARNIFIWFDETAPRNPRSPLADIGPSLASTTFECLQPVFPMPPIQDLNLEEIKGRLWHKKTKVVVLITEHESDVKELQNRLEQVGLALDFVQFREIRVNDVRIPLYVLKG
jgi:hypothetical protein